MPFKAPLPALEGIAAYSGDNPWPNTSGAPKYLHCNGPYLPDSKD